VREHRHKSYFRNALLGAFFVAQQRGDASRFGFTALGETMNEKSSATVPWVDHDNGVSSVRVLVAEDFILFRQYIASTLAKWNDLHVIFEASDGLEAVHKAEELKPDLILLDIGLPTLNGIEAARLIGTLSPKSKIIFVSQESSADVVQEAIHLGAWGYVAKTRAASDLLAAVQAVCEGKRFVSGGLWFQNFADDESTPTAQQESIGLSFPQRG
jgi:DNA-binding NarL/FixJ family response regulator